MGPVEIRQAIEAHLAGSSDLRELAGVLAAAVETADARGLRMAASVRSILHEAGAILAATDDPKARERHGRVLHGLCLEALETLPTTDQAPDLAQVIAVLEEVAPEMERKHGILIEGVVGSLARGCSDAFSDIDIAARDVGSSTGLSWFGAISDCTRGLSEKLGRPVDLVFLDAVDPVRRASFTDGMVALGGAGHAA